MGKKPCEFERIAPAGGAAKYEVKGLHIIPEKANWKNATEKLAVTWIDSHISQSSLIVIDPYLKSGSKSFLADKRKPWAKNVVVFDRVSIDDYAQIVSQLADVAQEQTRKLVLHISVDFGRGFDFAVTGNAMVFAMKEVESVAELR